MQENYWIHVELFPETASKYSATALNEIYDVLRRSRAGETKSDAPGSDAQRLYTLTSESPAFPHTDEEREELIDILEWSKGVFRLAHPAWPSVN